MYNNTAITDMHMIFLQRVPGLRCELLYYSCTRNMRNDSNHTMNFPALQPMSLLEARASWDGGGWRYIVDDDGNRK